MAKPPRKKLMMQAGLVLLCVALAGALIKQTQGPTYAGKPFEFWFKRYCQGAPTGNTNHVNLRALIAMGDAAVPYLVDYAFDFGSSWTQHPWVVLVWRTDPAALQRSAENVLRWMRPSFNALGPLALPKLGDRDPLQRRQALLLLGFTGHGGSNAVPHLITALDDPDPLAAVLAMQSLMHLGPEARTALTQLMKGLDDPNLRLSAMEALGRLGPEAELALPNLMPFLEGTNTYQRLVASSAIHRIQPSHSDTLELLVATARRGESQRDRVNAVRLLGGLRAEDKPFVTPVLLQCLAETNLTIASHALVSLRELNADPSQITQTLAPRLKSTDDTVRYNAASWILHWDAGHEEGLATLVSFARGRGQYALAAIILLGNLGLEEGTPVLEELSHDADKSVREKARDALKTIALSRRGRQPR